MLPCPTLNSSRNSVIWPGNHSLNNITRRLKKCIVTLPMWYDPRAIGYSTMMVTEGATVIIFFRVLKSSIDLNGNTSPRMGRREKNLPMVHPIFILGQGILFQG